MLNLKPKKTTLKNGIRLVTAQNKATNTVSVLMFFKTGSRNEDPKVQGISHFLEHMIFKGTKKRPNPIDITGLMDRIGAEFNAFTSLDQTGYYIKSEARHLPLVFDLLGDILLNSEFKASEMKRELGPIISELRMYIEEPQRYAQEVCYETLFGKTNLGRPVGGDEKTVSSITRKMLVDYYNKHYFANNLIVGVSGNIEEKNVLKLAQKHLGSFKKGAYHEPDEVKPKFQNYKIDLRYRPLKQVNAILSFPSYDQNHKDLYALKLLQMILGGGMSSRLFIEVREKRGLCYYVYASSDQFKETGGFFISSGIDAKRIDEALETIFKELEKMKKNGPTQSELKDALNHLEGRMMINFEDSFAVAEYIVTQEAFKLGGAKDIKTILENYKKVTAEDITRVARDIFQKKHLALTFVGPFKEQNATRFQKIIEKNLS